jgi:hypothetical protein
MAGCQKASLGHRRRRVGGLEGALETTVWVACVQTENMTKSVAINPREFVVGQASKGCSPLSSDLPREQENVALHQRGLIAT